MDFLTFIKSNWDAISRNGLRDNESIIEFRSIIFLNRVLAIAPVVLVFYIPIEFYFNGWKLIPLSLLLCAVFVFPLFLIKRRLFLVAKIFVFVFTQAFVFGAGLFVGKEVGNFGAFVPIVLLGVLLFETTILRFASLIMVVLVYCLQDYCFSVVSPGIDISLETKQLFSSIFMVMFIIMNFILGFYLINVNVEYESVISKHKELLELKNQEITDSVNYAKRIQDAYLPEPFVVEKMLPNSFLLFKPKDIVSGDFYWVYGTKNGDDWTVFAAVADCTGHGIPGALLSVICCNALNEVVVSGREFNPGRILDKTREIILTNLKSHKDGGRSDGMDISLVAISGSGLRKSLKWAGANNPLWIINPSRTEWPEQVSLFGENNEGAELKPDKQPVGKYLNQSPFTTQHVPVETGDTIYLFSDGFQDQFGGGKGKKFKASNVKSLLLSIHHRTMPDQKDILESTFDEWRGELEQIDDVCMLGIRL